MTNFAVSCSQVRKSMITEVLERVSESTIHLADDLRDSGRDFRSGIPLFFGPKRGLATIKFALFLKGNERRRHLQQLRRHGCAAAAATAIFGNRPSFTSPLLSRQRQLQTSLILFSLYLRISVFWPFIRHCLVTVRSFLLGSAAYSPLSSLQLCNQGFI